MKQRIMLKDIQNKTEQEAIYTEMTIAQLQSEFETSLKERGLRPVTLHFYNNVLEAFYKFADYNMQVCNINQKTITDYIKYCKEVRHHSDNTISTNLRGLRTFLYFGMKNGYLPKFQIHVPAPDLTPKTTYSTEEVQKLLIRPNIEHCNFSEYVAYIAINIFVFTGMRLSTAVNMKVEDIDFENNLVIYKHTKNKKPHCVPLAMELKEVLSKYIKMRKQQEIENEYLLISCYGEQLTTNRLYSYINAYNKKKRSKNYINSCFQAFLYKKFSNAGSTYT